MGWMDARSAQYKTEIDREGHKFRGNVAKFSRNVEISPILHLKRLTEP